MQRQPELTSLRGISALWVVAYHINILLLGLFDYPILDSGYLPVGVFFILSISLLLRSLDNNSDLKHYFTRRIRRIWPMYFATVLMVFFYTMHNLGWLASQLSFTAVFYDNKAINYVFWSLQVEEIAYIFFPLIHRLSETWKYRTGIGLFAAGALSSGLILYGLHVSTLAQWWWLPLSLSSYGLGVLVYLKKIPSLVLPSALIGVFFWGSDAFIAITWVSLPGFAYIVQNADHYKILKSKWLVKIGDISYGIYLIHWLLIDAFGWIGVAIFIPAAWAFEKANVLGLKGLDKLRKK